MTAHGKVQSASPRPLFVAVLVAENLSDAEDEAVRVDVLAATVREKRGRARTTSATDT